MSNISNHEIYQELLKLRSEFDRYKARNEALFQRFALYWVEDGRTPAFAIIVEHDEKTNKAQLCAMSRHWNINTMLFDKPKLKPTDLKKQGKWEPLILPQELFVVLYEAAKETDDTQSTDGAATSHSALTAGPRRK